MKLARRLAECEADFELGLRSNLDSTRALLDAELLADVYIHLTRGQDALLMDTASAQEGGAVVEQVDLRGFELPVLAANTHELASHEELLLQIDKSSSGKTVWRKVA